MDAVGSYTMSRQGGDELEEVKGLEEEGWDTDL